MKFSGKKVIVTGANRSMGQMLAIDFAKQGADVVISYRSDEAGATKTIEAIEATGQKGKALHADFSQIENVATFAKQAIDYLGQVDVLVNNAGMLCRETLLELPPEKMQLVFQVNTISPLYLLQLCANDMIEKSIAGCILNISSIAGLYTVQNGIGYASSKAAMNKWTQNAALNLASYGIRVNTIAPGVIQSGMNEDTEESNPARWQELMSSIPLQRAGTPADIVNMARFLASDEASWITGKVIAVDGGRVL